MSQGYDNQCILHLSEEDRRQLSPDQILEKCANCTSVIKSAPVGPDGERQLFNSTCWPQAARRSLLLRTSGVLQYLYDKYMDTNIQPGSEVCSKIVVDTVNFIYSKKLLSRSSLSIWYMLYFGNHSSLDPLHAAVAIKQAEFCVMLFLKQNALAYNLKLVSEPRFFTDGLPKYEEQEGPDVSFQFIEAILTVAEAKEAEFYLSQNKKPDPSESPFLSKGSLVVEQDTILKEWKYKNLTIP